VWGGCCAPFWAAGLGAGSPSNICRLGQGVPSTKLHLDPSNCWAIIHQRYRQTDRDRQTGRQTDRTTVPYRRANRSNGHPKRCHKDISQGSAATRLRHSGIFNGVCYKLDLRSSPGSRCALAMSLPSRELRPALHLAT